MELPGQRELINLYCVDCPKFHLNGLLYSLCEWRNNPEKCPVIYYLEFNKNKLKRIEEKK